MRLKGGYYKLHDVFSRAVPAKVFLNVNVDYASPIKFCCEREKVNIKSKEKII